MRSGNMGVPAGLLAGLDVLDLENVAAVGGGWIVSTSRIWRAGSAVCVDHVHDLVGHRLLDDQLVLGVDRDLNVVADAGLGMRGHGAAVGIGQRDLSLVGPLELRQHRLIWPRFSPSAAIFSARLLRACPAACRPVFEVAMVEPFEVFVQPLVGCTDERAQRRSG